MQIPKFFLAMNMVVLAVIPSAVRAAETKSSNVLAPVPVSQPAPMLLAQAGEQNTSPAGSGDSDAAARMRQAMRKALAEPAPETAPTPEPAAVKAKPAKVAKPVKHEAKEEEPKMVVVTPPAETAQPAPEAAEKPAEPMIKIVKPSKKQMKAEKPSESPKTDGGTKFTESPALTTPSPTAGSSDAVPSAVSASKEGRLAELLRQYKSDSITAEDYHKKRAAILAEP